MCFSCALICSLVEGDRIYMVTFTSSQIQCNFLFQEPKEEEMTEEEKAAQKARPVATTPIPGTPWYLCPQSLFSCQYLQGLLCQPWILHLYRQGLSFSYIICLCLVRRLISLLDDYTFSQMYGSLLYVHRSQVSGIRIFNKLLLLNL